MSTKVDIGCSVECQQKLSLAVKGLNFRGVPTSLSEDVTTSFSGVGGSLPEHRHLGNFLLRSGWLSPRTQYDDRIHLSSAYHICKYSTH